MLRPRIIPCLLLTNDGLSKTVQFGAPKYIGDPINAVRIFNEKEVDELIILDIDATRQRKEPNFGLIKNLAAECRMPLCYGGGVRSVEQVQKIIGLGVEKVAISAAAVEVPELISQAATQVGSQSIVVIVDVKKERSTGRYEVFTHNGTKRTGLAPATFAKRIQSLGAGELVLNSIDHDGLMKGYDMNIIEQVRDAINLPMTVLGGAGSLEDIEELVRVIGIVGAAAGSLFVFKGRYRAVLINYPGPVERESIIARAALRGSKRPNAG